jgi:hypothetical protein
MIVSEQVAGGSATYHWVYNKGTCVGCIRELTHSGKPNSFLAHAFGDASGDRHEGSFGPAIDYVWIYSKRAA